MFAELHTHTDKGSNTRLIDTTIKTRMSLNHALKIGLQGVAITDHESLSSHIEAIQHCQEIQKEHPDFKLVLGNEIYLIDDSDYKNTNKFYHFILLAKDKVGHRQLRELSTRAWGRVYSHKNVERVPTFYSDLQDIVSANQGHLVAMTACLGGLLPTFIMANETDRALNFAKFCVSVFGRENFYIEMQPGASEEQIEFNKRAYDFCLANDFNWVFTNDVHYLTQNKRILHAAYLNSKDEDRETSDFYENTYYKTEQEMRDRMPYFPDETVTAGFENTIKILNSVEQYTLAQDVIVPERQLPLFSLLNGFSSYYGTYEYIKNFATSEYQQDRFLLFQIEKGFKEKGEEYNQENLSRINIELKQLWDISLKLKQRLSSYYNLTQLIIEIMWDDEKGNSLVGVARGSVTGYYICYLMNITQINPIKWNLPYWRHLVAERPELPDVDIDSQSSQRPLIFKSMKDTFGWEHALNIITFKKETSKAAVLTACRGIGIDNDIGQEIASMVPITRGKVWSIKECLEGNEDNGYTPIHDFVKKIREYDMLLDTVLEIENLVCGRSSHASGFYLFNNHFLEQNSLMKAPSGMEITCWDMADSDSVGALKVDFLTVEALDKIRKTMDLLVANGRMEWQGSLKKTYEKYLHPNVLNYTEPKMWQMVGEGKIVDAFQFDTLTGGDAIRKIKPIDLKQLSIANSVMRLMGDADITPIDRFVKFKNNLALWYQEMEQAQLNANEVAVLEKYLKHNFGCSVEQEDVMELSMDGEIAGFDIIAANKLRKGIAKKKKDIIEATKELFFESGKKRGTRSEMLNYVWDYCIKPQLGYSFSRNHTLPYSAIGLQEMNLAYFYPLIYWNTACLTINASANEDIADNKSTNYGKIAKAIGDMKQQGVKIALPDINTANFGFTPDESNDQIIFGLKGINGIGDDVVNDIVSKRPFRSIEDFFARVATENTATINLIKAGCFDRIEDKERDAIMRDYTVLFTRNKVEEKNSLSMQNFNAILDLNILPKEFDFQKRLVNFKKYVYNKDNVITLTNSRGKTSASNYVLDETAKIFFENVLVRYLVEGEQYSYTEFGIVIHKGKFDKWFEEQIAPIREWLIREDTLSAFNKAQYNEFANENWKKYCTGNKSKWEMDSVSFYDSPHELAFVDKEKYNLTDFSEIPETPIVIETMTRNNKNGETRTWDKYQLYKIVGTILDKNANKHYITLLTTDGVVTVKFYDGAFIHYNKQISERVGDSDKKTVLEKSWFARGNKVLITGIRRGNMFYPKRYYDSIYQHTICLIEEVYDNGEMLLKYERERVS